MPIMRMNEEKEPRNSGRLPGHPVSAPEPSLSSLDRAIGAVMRDAEFPDLKAIICSFMRISGGAQGVAKMLKREYRDAKPGSMIRSMILNMILQGAKSVSGREGARDASTISDEDLNKELLKVLNEVPKSGKFNSLTDATNG